MLILQCLNTEEGRRVDFVGSPPLAALDAGCGRDTCPIGGSSSSDVSAPRSPPSVGDRVVPGGEPLPGPPPVPDDCSTVAQQARQISLGGLGAGGSTTPLSPLPSWRATR
jgi:hypothetical protein